MAYPPWSASRNRHFDLTPLNVAATLDSRFRSPENVRPNLIGYILVPFCEGPI